MSDHFYVSLGIKNRVVVTVQTTQTDVQRELQHRLKLKQLRRSVSRCVNADFHIRNSARNLIDM